MKQNLFEFWNDPNVTKADAYGYGWWRGFKTGIVLSLGIDVFIWICWRMFNG